MPGEWRRQAVKWQLGRMKLNEVEAQAELNTDALIETMRPGLTSYWSATAVHMSRRETCEDQTPVTGRAFSGFRKDCARMQRMFPTLNACNRATVDQRGIDRAGPFPIPLHGIESGRTPRRIHPTACFHQGTAWVRMAVEEGGHHLFSSHFPKAENRCHLLPSQAGLKAFRMLLRGETMVSRARLEPISL